MATLMIGVTCSATGAESFVIEEIVVTAQKRAESIQDVPIAMDAFGAEEIQSRQIVSIADLAAVSPSLSFGELAATAQISIRGVGFGFITGSGESSVAVHSDGVYISSPGALLFAQTDLGGLELLRGPQGTLWGRNVTGGVINFISPTPSDQLSGAIKLGRGNYQAQAISGHVNLPVSDAVRTRFSVDYMDRDDYIENSFPGGSDLGDVRRVSGRFAMDIDATDKLTLEVRVLAGEDEVGGPFHDPIDNAPLTTLQAIFLPFDFDPDPRQGAVNAAIGTESEMFLGSIRAEYALRENITLTSITGYIDFENTISFDVDNTTINAIFTDRRKNISETFSQEFNLSGNYNRGSWLLGAYYFREEKDVTIPVLNATPALLPIPGLGSFAGFDIDIKEDYETIAFFTDATFDLTEKMQMFGGLRYLDEERDGSYLRVDTIDDVVFLGGADGVRFTTCDEDYLLEDEKISGRLGIKYQWAETLMTYAQASTGYKSGGYATLASCGAAARYDPETLKAIEVGFKSYLVDGRLRLNGAAFFYDYADLQVEQVIGIAVLVANGDAEVKGLELSALYHITDGFQLEAGVTWLDAQYTDFFSIDTAGPTIVPGVPGQALQNLSGNPLPRSPEWKATIGVQYERIANNGSVLFARLDSLFSTSYQTREFDEPRDEQGSYQNVNLIASYTSPDSNWTLSLWGKNLTDEEVLLSTVDTSLFAGSGFQGIVGGTWNLPRTYGADIQYRF
ncbi:MAG: TonB-dependent receptor [Gammaproteobacteria bacterium]|nr:TonB-dependent receptor [Gammaproteobacteria bacterium]